MRFTTICMFCLLIIGCSSNSGTQADIVIPVMASPTPTSTIELPKPVDFECQNITGIIGSADISFDGKTVLYLYEKPNASQLPAQTLRFYDDKELKMDTFKAEGEKFYNLLRPEVHKLDYYLFDLAVRSRQNGWLEVMVDDQTKERLWIQENKAVKFEDWLQEMKNSFAVGSLNIESNPLRIKPHETAEKVSFNGNDCFAVTEMKGDWIKVNLQNHCSEAPEQSVSGWIRWRDENDCLLVEIFPFA